MKQEDLFTPADIHTTDGVRAMHNIEVDARKTAKYGQPEQSLKTAAKKLAALVSSGDLEIHEAESSLHTLYNDVAHLLLKPVDWMKIMKSGYRAVKQSLKEKARVAKEAVIRAKMQVSRTVRQARKTRKTKDILQGVMFGNPIQRLTNYDRLPEIPGTSHCWLLDKSATFCYIATVEV